MFESYWNIAGIQNHRLGESVGGGQSSFCTRDLEMWTIVSPASEGRC